MIEQSANLVSVYLIDHVVSHTKSPPERGRLVHHSVMYQKLKMPPLLEWPVWGSGPRSMLLMEGDPNLYSNLAKGG